MWEGIKSWKANSPALSTIYRLTRHCLLSHHSDCQSCLQPLLVNTVYMPDHWMLLYLNERVYCERNARATSITLSRLCIGLIQEGTSALLIHLAAYTVMLNLVTKTLRPQSILSEWVCMAICACVLCVCVFSCLKLCGWDCRGQCWRATQCHSSEIPACSAQTVLLRSWGGLWICLVLEECHYQRG